MPNIEKVIKGLEWCSRADKARRCVYDLVDCPYVSECVHDKRDQLKQDAIVLLKEYQAAKPMLDEISEQIHDAAAMFRINTVDSVAERLRADKDIAYKRLQVLEWLSEVAKEPETFTHELYSDSEISNIAADTLVWINELAERNIVFCKDCRYRNTESCLVNYVSSREDYWFCEDGERKENN